MHYKVVVIIQTPVDNTAEQASGFVIKPQPYPNNDRSFNVVTVPASASYNRPNNSTYPVASSSNATSSEIVSPSSYIIKRKAGYILSSVDSDGYYEVLDKLPNANKKLDRSQVIALVSEDCFSPLPSYRHCQVTVDYYMMRNKQKRAPTQMEREGKLQFPLDVPYHPCLKSDIINRLEPRPTVNKTNRAKDNPGAYSALQNYEKLEKVFGTMKAWNWGRINELMNAEIDPANFRNVLASWVRHFFPEFLQWFNLTYRKRLDSLQKRNSYEYYVQYIQSMTDELLNYVLVPAAHGNVDSTDCI